jgi:hypothetical protein
MALGAEPFQLVFVSEERHGENLLDNSNTDISNEYNNQCYLDIVEKILSVTFFGNENQLASVFPEGWPA